MRFAGDGGCKVLANLAEGNCWWLYRSENFVGVVELDH